jgi:hypothetical protein
MRLKTRIASRGLKARALATLGITMAAVAAAAIGQAAPALADPSMLLVAVGSADTQDVFNQFAVDLAGNALDSYDATTQLSGAISETITPVDGSSGTPPLGTRCEFPRPDDSGAGYQVLRISVGLATPPLPPQQVVGCVDVAREAFGPGSTVANGALAWMSFATDGTAGATGPAVCSGTPNPCASYQYTYTNGTAQTVTATPVPTAIIQANVFSVVDLVNLYRNCLAITEGGVTYDPNATIAGATPIDLYLPPIYTDTAKFWANTLGFSLSPLPSCVHSTIVGGALAAANPAVPVADFDTTPVATDPNGFEPFPISQWIYQRNHPTIDQRHAAVLHNLTPCTGILLTNPATGSCTAAPVSPFGNGNPATGNQSLSFPIIRELYNIAPFARVTNTADPLYSLLNNASVVNFVCSEQAAILTYGFAPSSPSPCGTIVARTN